MTEKELLVKSGETVLVFGDAVTAGGGYVRDVEAVLARQYPKVEKVKVVNVGGPGWEVRDLAARFEEDVLARKPALVLINAGVNDVWHRLGKNLDEDQVKSYRESLEEMTAKAKAAGIKVALLAPTLIKEDSGFEGNQRLKRYAEVMQAVAKEKECRFVDLHAMFLAALKKKPADEKGNWLTLNGVHPRAPGNGILAVGVLRAMGASDERIAAGLPEAAEVLGITAAKKAEGK